MDVDRYRKWTHFSITDALLGRAWGTGGIGVGDFAGNGRLDVAVSRREPQTAYWFERTAHGAWVRHGIGQSEQLRVEGRSKESKAPAVGGVYKTSVCKHPSDWLKGFFCRGL